MALQALFKNKWFYIVGLIFILANGYFLLREEYFFSLLPLALIAIYVAIYHFELLFLFIIFATPLSINIEEFVGGSIGLFLPTEPLLFGMLLLLTLKQIKESVFDKNFLKHPITIIVLIQISWLILTSFTSELPLVSFKFLLARLWFVIPIYFYGAHFFKKEENIIRFVWLFVASMSIVATYTLIQHASYGFDEETGHWVMFPFFKDHTSYGAILAVVFPPIVGLLLYKKNNALVRLILIFLLFLIGFAIIMSYTRAAWLSLFAAFVIYLLIRFRVKFKYLAALGMVGLLYIAVNWTAIQHSLEKNKSEHATEEFDERLESMTNITSDASNLERLNRWNSAYHMWLERPVLGWGPGTYAMVYAPFQLSSDLTIISTHSGNRGNAHSEYLGPLSEQGLPGMILMIILVAYIMYSGVTVYYRIPDEGIKFLYLMLLLGLSTYFIHGFLNNYLDTDKASIPVWGITAIIVMFDLKYRRNNKQKTLAA